MNRKHMKYVLALVMLFGVFPQMVFAADPNVYTSIIVSDITSGSAVIGGVFTTDISLSIANNADPTTGIMGLDLWLQFDDTILAVDDADDNPGNGIQVTIQGGALGGSVVVAANEVIACPGGGTCVHVAMSRTGSPIYNWNGKVATVTWAGLAAGPANLVVTPDTVFSDQNGQDVAINSIVTPAITVIEPGIINGTVLRQGSRTDHANTDVVAYNTSGGVVAFTTTIADGSFELPVPAGGTYLVQANYNGYLKTQKTNVYVVGAMVPLGSTTLKGGDVNDDNNINILDIVSIISRYGTTGWAAAEPADINDDGTINIFDLTIAAGNFGRYGPVTW
ncbi:MAG: carboxypeptidase regulatory-like domain-containing protein [Anaerolineae bacterium]|nr:carboxypeptidase regulatory-like domain-containing protein [Anaerolineae bacterium]